MRRGQGGHIANTKVLELDIMVDDRIEVEEVNGLDYLKEDGFDEGVFREGLGILEDILKEVTTFNVLMNDIPPLGINSGSGGSSSGLVFFPAAHIDVQEADDVGMRRESFEGFNLLLYQPLRPL